MKSIKEIKSDRKIAQTKIKVLEILSESVLTQMETLKLLSDLLHRQLFK